MLSRAGRWLTDVDGHVMVHYPDGYRVDVRGGQAVSEEQAELLRLATDRGAERVTVRLSRRV